MELRTSPHPPGGIHCISVREANPPLDTDINVNRWLDGAPSIPAPWCYTQLQLIILETQVTARALFLQAAVLDPEDVHNPGASGPMAWALKAAVQAPDDVHPPWGSSNARWKMAEACILQNRIIKSELDSVPVGEWRGDQRANQHMLDCFFFFILIFIRFILFILTSFISPGGPFQKEAVCVSVGGLIPDGRPAGSALDRTRGVSELSLWAL
ncbi:unnamed protein product [Boreogadus saida]